MSMRFPAALEVRSASGPDCSTRSRVRCAASSVMLMTWLRRARASGISFSAISASFDSMLKRSSAFCRSPVSLRNSPNIPGSRMCTMWSTAAKKAFSSSMRRASVRASTQELYSNFSKLKLDMLTSLTRAQDLVELFFQRFGCEGLDDVAVHTGLGGLDDLLALGFRRQHENRHLGELGIRAHRLDQVQTGHAGHVLVGDEKVEAARLEHRQRGLAVIGFVDVGIAEVVQQIFDNTAHGREIIDHQEFQIFAHSPSPATRALPAHRRSRESLPGFPCEACLAPLQHFTPALQCARPASQPAAP